MPLETDKRVQIAPEIPTGRDANVGRYQQLHVMTRRGKIARLPKDIREELNQRLQNGEAAAPLLQWLNGLPAVQEILKAHFAGEPVSEPNLSGWRSGGYLDWVRAAETLEVMSRVQEEARNLGEELNGAEISDCMGTLVAAEMARLARTLFAQEPDPVKCWKRLCSVHKQLSRMRRDDHREVRVMIKRDEWQRAAKEMDKPQMSREEREQRIREIYASI